MEQDLDAIKEQITLLNEQSPELFEKSSNTDFL